MHRPLTPLLTLLWLWSGIQPCLGHELDPVEITGHYDNAIGSSEAASQGAAGAQLLGHRASARPAEILEYIPGMVVTQHSGDGKANQYFLRGMNLDHGTDFATTINGVPVNMPTHAHGQGYSDLNFLIPELVSRVNYRKGPYFASDGDFASAGSADVVYRTRLDKPMLAFSLGQRGYQRVLAADSRPLSDDVNLLTALERQNNDGPWTVPEGMRKTNAQFILSGGSRREGWSGSLSAYAAHWHATDQVPQRLIDAGSDLGQPFGRFDSLDPSDGAQTRRTSLSAMWQQASEHEVTRMETYLIRYDLQLFSNFTYSLERANDQFAQTDQRTAWGGKFYRTWLQSSDGVSSSQNTLGVQLRQDKIRVGLYDTVARLVQATVRDDDVNQMLLGVYGENEMTWMPWLRSVAGLRLDQFHARVASHVHPENSGTSSAVKASPKFSLILGPWHNTEFFLNAGRGFHSNDARGTTSKIDPRTGAPIDTVQALVGSKGHELGMKTQLSPSFLSSLALWRLDFDSELVYVGDAGNTEAGRPSRRTGVEWSNHWIPTQALLLDANLAWTRPRYSGSLGTGAFIANAVQQVANLHLTWREVGQWSASWGLRYIGPAPLTEDNSVRSAASLSTQLRLQRKVSSSLDLVLDVLNLDNRKNTDISYFYTSRLVGEPAAGVSGLHVHPAEPRTVKLTARLTF